MIIMPIAACDRLRRSDDKAGGPFRLLGSL
jgi:hypothetical protein